MLEQRASSGDWVQTRAVARSVTAADSAMAVEGAIVAAATDCVTNTGFPLPVIGLPMFLDAGR